MGIGMVEEILNEKDEYGRTRRDRHDPTGSFSPGELAAIVKLMDMPISYWVEMIKTGRASKSDTKNWMEILDKIEPGYGELMLGGILKSEQEQLQDSIKVPVNYKKVGDKIVPYLGDRNHSAKDYEPKSLAELEALKKVQDAEYELKKAKFQLEEVRSPK
jgi:hypothetical protein